MDTPKEDAGDRPAGKLPADHRVVLMTTSKYEPPSLEPMLTAMCCMMGLAVGGVKAVSFATGCGDDSRPIEPFFYFASIACGVLCMWYRLWGPLGCAMTPLEASEWMSETARAEPEIWMQAKMYKVKRKKGRRVWNKRSTAMEVFEHERCQTSIRGFDLARCMTRATVCSVRTEVFLAGEAAERYARWKEDYETRAKEMAARKGWHCVVSGGVSDGLLPCEVVCVPRRDALGGCANRWWLAAASLLLCAFPYRMWLERGRQEIVIEKMLAE
jgi:hypothetical protein